MHQLDSFAPASAGTALGATLYHAVVLSRGLQHLLPLEDVVRHRLFKINILARLHGPNGGKRVPVVGGGDEHGLDGGVVEGAAHVSGNGGALAGILADPRGCLFRAVAVGVHQSAHLYEGNLHKLPHKLVAAASHADDGDAHWIVRRDSGLAKDRGACHGGGVEKTTSVHVLHSINAEANRLSPPFRCATMRMASGQFLRPASAICFSCSANWHDETN